MRFQDFFNSPPLGRGYAMGLMLFGSIVISFSGLLIRNISSADTWEINFYRSLAFGFTISVLLTFKYGKSAPQKVKLLGPSGIFAAALMALAGITFLQAINNTTVAATTFTLCVIPFLTAVMARLFLGERVTKSTMLTMVAATLGISLMFVQGVGTGSYYGNGMAFLCAMAFSGYATVVRRNRGSDMLPALILSNVIIILIVLLFSKVNLIIPWKDLLLCLILGGILSATVNTLFVVASKHLLAAELTLFMLLEFTFGPIWVWIFLNEIPSTWTLLGGIVVISAVIVKSIVELRWVPFIN